MNAKANRQTLRTAKKLARELQANVRLPGFLSRLCRWERQRQHHGLFTLQHRHD